MDRGADGGRGGPLARLARFALGPLPEGLETAAVRRRLAASRRQAELLISAAQAGAILFFAAFYVLTPKAFPPDAPFEPVPVALAAYAAFTLLRFRLAQTDRLGPAFLSLSVVVDIAVLMATIWSFHLQYEAPPAIYLKAPTLLYVFILIALRALRFEAGYVLLAGAAAILGWLVLVAVALLDGARVTRDFADYMTSHAVLIGAEVDKLVSIAVVSGVLALGAERARRLMIRAAADAQAAETFARFLPDEAASRIRDSAEALRPGDAALVEAAALILDLRGFTPLAERLGPTRTVALLAELHARVAPPIREAGGSIDKFLGDGLLATFGAARPSDRFAAEAFAALAGIVEAMADWNRARAAAGEERLGYGLAVTVGPVLYGALGDGRRLEFTVVGHAVNLAAKLEKHAKVEGRAAVSTAAALDRARSQGFAGAGRFDPAPGRRIAGVAGRIDLVLAGPRL